MSTIADHDYIPEEHAPDPVIGHGDPTPPGRVAIWLFLASEIMFFIGVLGSYIILRAGSHDLFSKMAGVLSKPLAGANTLVLIFSSLTMALSVEAAQKNDRKRLIVCLFLTLLCACGFMVIKSIEYNDKWHHNTIVARDSETSDSPLYVYDGHVTSEANGALMVHGVRTLIPAGQPFDIHLISPTDVEEGLVFNVHEKAEGASAQTGGAKQPEKAQEKEWTIPANLVVERTNYFPWKNMFFACYFTLTGIHGVHVLGGMVAIFILLVQAMRGKIYAPHTEYIGLYWHFVDLVWIFLFPLLYLI